MNPYRATRVIVSCLALIVTACTWAEPGTVTANVPAGTEAVIAIDGEGNARFLSLAGEALPTCKLCTPELEEAYGEGCAKGIETGEVCAPEPIEPIELSKQRPVLAPSAPARATTSAVKCQWCIDCCATKICGPPGCY